MLPAQCVAQSAPWNLDVIVSEHVVSRDVPPKTTAFGEADRKKALGVNDLRVLAQAVGHVLAKPVQDLSGLEILLRGCNHVDVRRAERSDCCISEDRRAGNRPARWRLRLR